VGFVDLASRVDEPGVAALLTDAFGSSRAVLEARARYLTGEWGLLGYEERTAVLGLIGFERTSPTAVRIRGMAVDPRRRREGIGRVLVHEVGTRNRGSTLHAETDGDAVGFYARCGFEVSSLGERYPGVERFHCRSRV
jgi:GNAT superfamily N-acetyltransferase